MWAPSHSYALYTGPFFSFWSNLFHHFSWSSCEPLILLSSWPLVRMLHHRLACVYDVSGNAWIAGLGIWGEILTSAGAKEVSSAGAGGGLSDSLFSLRQRTSWRTVSRTALHWFVAKWSLSSFHWPPLFKAVMLLPCVSWLLKMLAAKCGFPDNIPDQGCVKWVASPLPPLSPLNLS